ncbi:MAG TPA: DUF362 domain-containing protein [Acidobacteriota bacterium]|nr:DUF362 domain-containing protein [Acidobacteriota bacterium]
MSRVVVVKSNGKPTGNGFGRQEYVALLSAGLGWLSGENEVRAALRKYLPSGTIGMKTNCLVGRRNSTPVALVDALSQLLTGAGFDENDLVVWDRTNRELAGADFPLNAASRGRRCLGTDTNGAGYSEEFYSFGEVNSLVTRILTDMVDHNVNLPVLKDHSIAGLSAGLKNMYGAIHNPNKYHGNNCDPYCAHVSNLSPIRQKNRLTVLDAVRVQYDRGPGFVGRHMYSYNGVVISDDPVAADRVGLEILERIRAINGLPSLEKAGRPVKYLGSAEATGLGTADLSRIDLNVVLVDADGRRRPGELF